jgi:hypothetical protein
VAHPPIPDDIQLAMVMLYQEGKSMKAAAAAFGKHPPACEKALKRFGVASRPKLPHLQGVKTWRLTPEQKAEAILAYHDREPMADIAARFGISVGALDSYVASKRRGEKRQRHMATPEERLAMADAYAAGKTLEEAGQLIGGSPAQAKKAMARLGRSARCQSDAQRVFHLNEGFFERIDTPAKAWVLGWITADGCVHPESTKWTIEILTGDRFALERMQDVLETDRPIADYLKRPKRGADRRAMSRLTISSKKMCEDLQRHGVGPRKSLTVIPWAGPTELMPHFWRGCLEGDGWYCHNKKGQWRVGLVGSRATVDAFNDFVFRLTGRASRIRPSSSVSVVNFDRRDVCIAVAESLYADAGELFLPRKRVAAAQLVIDCKASLLRRRAYA